MTGPTPAVPELVALAIATRPDWRPDAVREALVCAQIAGLTWGQVLAAMGRLMATEDAVPFELTAAAPKAWRSPQPGDYDRGAAMARAEIRTPTTTDPPEGGRA